MGGLKAERIVELLEFSLRDRRRLWLMNPRSHGWSRTEPWRVQGRISRHSEAGELIKALQQTTNPRVRSLLLYTVSRREEVDAVPVIIPMMDDPEIRSDAVDALWHIAHPSAGEVLLRYYDEDAADAGMRGLYMVALGACRYRPAIPLFIQALDDTDENVRAYAARNLAYMNVIEARDGIERVMERASKYQAGLIARALEVMDERQRHQPDAGESATEGSSANPTL